MHCLMSMPAEQRLEGIVKYMAFDAMNGADSPEKRDMYLKAMENGSAAVLEFAAACEDADWRDDDAAQPASEPATCAVCPWCDYRLPLPGEDYSGCPRCYGSFSFRKPIEPPPASEPACTYCNGTGLVQVHDQSNWQTETCPICKGMRVISKPGAAIKVTQIPIPPDVQREIARGLELGTKAAESAQPPASEPSGREESLNSLEARLAADIRAIDGNHDKGAAELAEQLIARGWFSQSARLEASNAKLDAVAGLVEKWRAENGDYPEAKRDCADELAAALAGGGK
jgi:hypothetical protein